MAVGGELTMYRWANSIPRVSTSRKARGFRTSGPRAQSSLRPTAREKTPREADTTASAWVERTRMLPREAAFAERRAMTPSAQTTEADAANFTGLSPA